MFPSTRGLPRSATSVVSAAVPAVAWAVVWAVAFLSAVTVMAGFVVGFLAVDSAAAADHPPLDVTQVDMKPEKGWGVADQNPQNTMTETLDVLVWDMLQVGDRMFVAGAFLNVKSGKNAEPISQPYLAAFDVATGDWDSGFRPQFDRAIYALDVLPNGSLLVGGEFEEVNGTSRKGLVAIDSETAQIDTSFSGRVDRVGSSRRATVRDIEVEPNGLIYVAGSFSHLEGANSQRLFASKVGRFRDSVGTIDTSWNPLVSGGSIWGLDTDRGRGEVAMSGFFTSVNGEFGSGNFRVVDDRTGETVPNKTPIIKNDGGIQPEVFDVVYGNDILFHIGEQHMVQVLDTDTHNLLGFHTTGMNDGFVFRGANAGGGYQAGDVIGDVLIAGCHCTSGGENHYESFTQRRIKRYNVMAYDLTTGRHIEAFDAEVDSPRDGHWAAASDTNGCLWLGGDYHLGGRDSGPAHWLGGFARMCIPKPQVNVVDPGPQITTSGDQASLQIETVGGRNVAVLFSATGLPAGLTINPVTGLITGSTDQVGRFDVTVNAEVLAGEGDAGSTTFTWVAFDDVAPVIDPIGDRRVVEMAPTKFAPRASDAEGWAFTWTASGLPVGMTINANTGIIDGAPTTEGVYEISLTATDAVGLADSTQFTITVETRTSRPAVVDHSDFDVRGGSYFLGPQFEVDQTMYIGEFGVHDANRDGAISNTGPTTAVLYDAGTGLELARVDVPVDAPLLDHFAYGRLTEPVRLEPGTTYLLASEQSGEPFAEFGSLELADGIRFVGSGFKVGAEPAFPTNLVDSTTANRYLGPSFQLLAPDQAPDLNPIADRMDIANGSVELQPELTEDAGRTLTWSAGGLPPGLIQNASSGLITGSPTTPGVYDVVITVTDPDSRADSERFWWTIVDDDAPSINPIDDATITEFEPVLVQPSLNLPETDVVWAAIDPPGSLEIDSVTGEIVGSIPEAGTYEVTVTATDVVELTGSQSFTITVTERDSINAVKSHTGFSTDTDDVFGGFVFEVDRQMEIGEFGIRDADDDGVIANIDGTTIVLYDETTKEELARTTVPESTPVVDDFAWHYLDEAYTLEPGRRYLLAAQFGQEPFVRSGVANFIDGVTPLRAAWRPGNEVAWPWKRGEVESRLFGPSFRVLDSLDGGNAEGTDPNAILTSESDWRYNDDGVDLGSDWRQASYNDSQWGSGAAPFGFGNGDEATAWTPGFVTYYARTTFEFSGDRPESLLLNLQADDGAVVYLNGTEILRDNLPNGRITADTTAIDWRGGSDEDFAAHIVPSDALAEGTNVIAVEVHNVWRANRDLSFDLEVAPFGVTAQPVAVASGNLIETGSVWNYTDSTNGEPAGWKKGLAGSTAGAGQLGFGDGDEATELVPGADAYYFTHTFGVVDPSTITELSMGLAADDGAVVYLNGTEIYRTNMPSGLIRPTSRPLTWKAGPDEKMQTVSLSADALVAGTNVIAVEVHNLWPGNSDVSFDLRLAG